MDVRTLTALLLVTVTLSGCFGGSEDAPAAAAPDPAPEPNAPPTPPPANISWTPTEPVAGEPVTFSVNPAGNVSSAFWTLGTRTVLAANPVHTFDAGAHARQGVVPHGWRGPHPARQPDRGGPGIR